MDIILSGGSGRMGTVLSSLLQEGGGNARIVASVSPHQSDPLPPGVCRSYSDIPHVGDVVIDFSRPGATEDLLAFCRSRKLPLVIGTTGQSGEDMRAITEASREIPVFISANLSLGVACLIRMVKDAVKTFPDAEIEIVEMHHDRKTDVPSGTALMIADAVKSIRPDATYNIGRPEGGRRRPGEIGIHSLRLGDEPGTHEILISTGSETLTLTHKANDRKIFARGALSAAAWLVGRKPGLYGMDDLGKEERR